MNALRSAAEKTPEELEVDRRIREADVAPVDDAGQLAVLDEQMAEVEIAMDERRLLRLR
jgi:hypothetical protein